MSPVRFQMPEVPLVQQQVDASPAWIVMTNERPQWNDLPYGAELLRRRGRHAGEAPEVWATDLPNLHATRAVHVTVSDTATAFERLSLARRAMDLIGEINPRELLISGHGLAEAGAAYEAFASAALARVVTLPTHRRQAQQPSRLARIRLVGPGAAIDHKRVSAEARANGLARQLSVMPPNQLTPGHYRERLSDLATREGLDFEFLGHAALRKRGAGAFLAVAQGSSRKDAGIAHLSWHPPRRRQLPRLALVGKGLCYDTGGVNLKSARGMFGMHQDMAGSAVALGVMLALKEIGAPFQLDCWLALAANDIGPEAYQPNDVVSAADGTTIEIVHTDAEGRMVLADTLLLATASKPDLVIDYATLTGACINALGKRYSGVFSNRDALLPVLIAAGRASGERVWPFPLDPDFDKALESSVADIKQCAMDGEADHIIAARFLQRFVRHEVPWIHLDLAASQHKGGLAHVPTEETGFGVRYTCNLLLDQQVFRVLGRTPA